MAETEPSETEVLDLVARLAKLLTRGGYEGTLGVEECLSAVAAAYGHRAESAVFAEAAVVSIGGASRVVTHAPDIPQLNQVSAFKTWLAEVTSGRVPIAEAKQRLDRIASMPMPYPAWSRVLGVVLFSVGFGVSIQPTLQEVYVTAALGVIVGVIYVGVQELRRPFWLAPLLASTVVGVVVLLLARNDWISGGTVELMIPVLFVFIPGDAITMAMVELSVGRLTAGSARLIQSLAALFALAFGPLLASAALGMRSTEIFDKHVAVGLGPWAGWVGWTVFAVGVMLVFGMRLAELPWTVLMVLGTYAVQLLTVRVVGEIAGTFVTAAAMATACLLIGAKNHRPPAYVLYLPPFFILTPGAHGLRGLDVVLGDTVNGAQDLVGMFTLIAAIAFGVLTATALLPGTTLYPGSLAHLPPRAKGSTSD